MPNPDSPRLSLVDKFESCYTFLQNFTKTRSNQKGPSSMTTRDSMRPRRPEWQIGKTAAAIKFVHLAESYLITLEHDPLAVTKLQEIIDEVKQGKTVVPEDSTPQSFYPT